MSRSIRLVQLMAAVVFSLSAMAEEAAVGVILPLSGVAASYGKACLNGVQMAEEELAESLKGRVRVVVEDDANTATNTVSAMRSLRQRHRAEIFLTWASNTTKSIVSQAEREGVTVFAIASDPELSKGRKFIFQYWVSPQEEIRLLISKLKRERIKRVAVVTALQDGVQSFRASFIKQAAENGTEVVFDEEVSSELKDFRPLLIKLKGISGVDGIFNNVYVAQTGLLAKQARELGVRVPLFGVEMYEDSSVLELAEGSLEGEFFVNASDGTGEFIRRYRARFSDDSIFAAANCYDFIGLLAAAPTLTPEGFADFLRGVKQYSGAVGVVSSTGDQKFSLPAAVKYVRGTEFVVE